MHIVVQMQYRENYGTPASPHWKFKGGDSFVFDLTTLGVERYDTEVVPSQREMDELILAALPSDAIYSNDMSEQYLLGWNFEDLSDVFEEHADGVDAFSPDWSYVDHFTFMCDYRSFVKGESYFCFRRNKRW